jgi:LETM1 and EF-hand domain-containing protein 1
LPILLRFFPNILPSSFQTTSQKEMQAKTIGTQRTELASYMQEMVADVEKRVKAKAAPGTSEMINALVDFVERSRNHLPLDPKSIPLLIKTFSDELTLERMSRTQLQLLCRYMGAPVLGSDDYLRFALLARLRALKADDMQIYAEGVNDLTLEELKKAALERGMRAESSDMELYRKQLSSWIELSVIHNVSPTMLILSRAFAVEDPAASSTSTSSASKVLSSALQSELVQDALSSAVDQASPGEVQPNVLARAKLETLKGQNELIKEESEKQKKKIEGGR